MPRVRVAPTHIGLLVLNTGVPGIGFTVTTTVATGLVQPAAEVVVTEYVPLAAAVAPTIFGFCAPEAKAFGPVQLQLVPPVFVEVRFNVAPAHIGLLLPAVGAAGLAFTVTTIEVV